MNVSTLLNELCHHVSSSKKRFILRDDIKMRLYHAIEGLKSVIMDGPLIKLASDGFKMSSSQQQMVAVQLENTVS